MTAEKLAALLTGQAGPWWLASSYDPAAVLEAAAAHGVLPLLAERAASPSVSCAPALRDALSAAARRLAAADVMAERDLRAALEALADAGAVALLMKGADLAYSRYARPDLRPRVDSDLLVDPSQRDAAASVLIACGYERVPQSGGDLLMYQEPFRKYRDGRETHVIDLHWRVANPQRFGRVIEFNEAAEAAEPRPALSPRARGLGRVHALVLACVHRIAHHFDAPRLIWIHDVHVLACALTPADWRFFVDHARDRAVQGACWRSLTVAIELFGTPVPASVAATLQSGSADEPGNDPFVGRGVRHAERVLSDLRAVGGWGSRWRLAKQHVFPPGRYMRDVYAPASAAPLWALYVLRILRGSRRWLSRS